MSEFTDSFHQLTASIISQLTSFLQLRYDANHHTQTPFSTHPATMLVAVSSFMAHYFLNIAPLRSPTSIRRFVAAAQHFLVWSGYAAVSTLAAAVFPDRAAPSLYVIFGLLSAGEVFKFVFGDEEEEASTIGVCRRRVGRFLKKIFSGRVAKFFPKQPQPILPI